MRGFEQGRSAYLPALPAAAPLFSALLVGVAVTALTGLSPGLPFGIRSPAAHLVLDTVASCIGLLVAALLYGRFVRSHRLQDAMLGNGVALLVLAGLGLESLSRHLGQAANGSLEVWWPLSVRLLGAALILGSALAGDRCVGGAAARLRWPLVVMAALLAPLALLLPLRERLPVALDLTSVRLGPTVPLLTGHPLLLGAQSAAACCFFIAAVLFYARAARSGDVLLHWVAPVCVLAGFARVNYLLFPSLYTDWLYTGDLLRTGCYLLFLVAAAREIQDYWRAQSQVAILEDRRRLARELHDGVVQELAYIRSQSHVALPGSQLLGGIVAACDRALDEARSAVHALGSDTSEPLDVTLERAARQLTERYGVRLETELQAHLAVDATQRHALVRIAREAVHNAIRHGGARTVTLALRTDAWSRVLEIRDDGRGFEVRPAAPSATSYGMRSMRERAQSLPGTFEVRSEPDHGAVVTVRW